MTRRAPLLPCFLLLTTACSAPAAPPAAPPVRLTLAQMPAVDAAALLADTRKLASDEFGGRAPGSPGEELTVNYLVRAVQGGWRRAGQSRRHLGAESAARKPHTDQPLAPRSEEGRPLAVVQAARSGRRLQPARRRCRRGQGLGDCLCRLRRAGAGISVGRLQGPGRQGQDAPRPRQRPPSARPGQSRRARPEDVRRQGHDLLRPLDLQVREGRGTWRGGRVHRPRDRAGGLSVQRRAGLRRRTFRPGDAGQEHGPRGDPGVALARGRHGAAEVGRPGLPGAEGAGTHARVHACRARHDGFDVFHAEDAQRRLAQCRREDHRAPTLR